DFPVEDRVAHRELPDRAGETRKARRPVVGAPGAQADVGAVDPAEHAIAVELDLVEPLLAVRSPIDERGELGLGILRHRRPPSRTASNRLPDRVAIGLPDSRRTLDPEHALRPRLREVLRAGRVVLLLDEEPVLLVHADEIPRAAELHSVEPELEMALAVAVLRIP